MKIHELLKSPNDWTRRDLAVDKNGLTVSVFNPNAVKFCLLGAAVKCYGQSKNDYNNVITKLNLYIQNFCKQRNYGFHTIMRFNDYGYDEVISACRELDI